jgi:NAD-dependent DNA ligase
MQALIQKLTAANETYRNGTGLLMTDDEYDEGIEMLSRIDPNHPLVHQVGANASQRSKTSVLPHRMASLDKAKVQEDLTKFIKRQPVGAQSSFILSEKLDGISGLWSPEKKKLYLRGNGIVGVDISHYLPYIQTCKTALNFKDIPDGIWIRGELILPKSAIPEGRLGRSIVNGIFHHDVPNVEEANKVRFVAYEIIGMDNSVTAQQHYEWLQAWNLHLPWNQSYTTLPDASILTKLLEERILASDYDMDGIVIRTGKIAKSVTKGNPTDCIAWKPPRGETRLTKVLNVEWNASANGRLVPRVEIEPVSIGGSTISFVTGTHARRILDWKIGKNAVVVIRKGGDVIPVLDSVHTPTSETEEQVLPRCTWEWDGVNIKQKEADKATKAAQLLKMAVKLEWDSIGPSQMKTLVEAGYTTVPAIRALSEKELQKHLGPVKGSHFYQCIQKDGWTHKDEITLFIASPISRTGIGATKLEYLAAIQSDVTLWSKPSTFTGVKGWSPDSLKEFQKLWAEYESFRKTEWSFLPYPQVLSQPTQPSQPVAQKGSVVFSGFRDAELEATLTTKGYKVVDTVKADTRVVLIPNTKDVATYTSTKIEKAKTIPGCLIARKADWTPL